MGAQILLVSPDLSLYENIMFPVVFVFSQRLAFALASLEEHGLINYVHVPFLLWGKY